MPDNGEAKSALAELKDVLAAAEGLTDEERESISQTVARVEARLAGASSESSGFLQTVEQGLSRFEAEHPDLTAIVARVVNALSDAGI